MNTAALWTQFRRLVLGTVVELFVAEKLPLDVATLAIRFDPESRFDVPRLNNYMRFKGEVSGSLHGLPDLAALARVEAALLRVWPELLEVVDLPIGDRLTPEKAAVRITVEADGARSHLRLRFDLEAD